jgi:hypothetical protein
MHALVVVFAVSLVVVTVRAGHEELFVCKISGECDSSDPQSRKRVSESVGASERSRVPPGLTEDVSVGDCAQVVGGE